MQKTLIIRDAIHGDIKIEPEYQEIISHSLFQRLRHIGQTGLLYLIYPGMRHSRFEHSLGAHALAKTWFNSILEKFGDPSQRKKFFDVDQAEDLITSEGCQILLKQTSDLYGRLFNDGVEKKRWERIVSTAALLHDVGHGPLSHTIESFKILDLKNYEGYCTGFVAAYIQKKISSKIKHEDISLVYTSRILQNLASDNFFQNDQQKNLLCVCALFHKHFRPFVLAEKDSPLTEDDRHLINLFSHIVGGLFDVDRLDYLERDSKHAGVNYGLVEGERIPKSLVPVLWKNGNAVESGLIIKSRMVHALDHFLVCLYEMYTQLYKHPSYEGFQHEVSLIIDCVKDEIPTLVMGTHEKFTDFSFFTLLNEKSDGLFLELIERRCKSERDVFQKYSDSSIASSTLSTFTRIGHDDREIVKDGTRVWLIDRQINGSGLIPWNKASLVAGKLMSERYSPQIWWKNPDLILRLEKLKNQVSSKRVQKNETA